MIMIWLTVIYCQVDCSTPLCCITSITFHPAPTPVLSTVGRWSRTNPVFMLIWRFQWAGSFPFIRPLSVSSLDLTADTDPLSSVDLSPVGLQSHNSPVWDCSWSRIYNKNIKIPKGSVIKIYCFSIHLNDASWIYNRFILHCVFISKLTNGVNPNFLTLLCVVNWVSSSSSAAVDSSLWDTDLSSCVEISIMCVQRFREFIVSVPVVFPTRWWVHRAGQCHSAPCWYCSFVSTQLSLWFSCHWV